VTTTSNKRITFGEQIEIHSDALQEDRPILVHLPEDYNSTETYYPVVYLLNGDFLPRFLNTAASIELLSDMGQIPNMIIIGIADINHWRDWFPFELRGQGGGADNMLRFFGEELIPNVNKLYRTVPYNILMGGSNTAMFTIYTLLVKPEFFNAYVAVSPMLGWNFDFFKDLINITFSNNFSQPKFLYLTYGTEDYPQVIDSTQEFTQILKEKASPNSLIWDLKILQDQGHVPLPWVYNSLISIFPDWKLPQKKKEEGFEGIKHFYNELTNKYGFEAKIPEEILTDLVFELMVKEKLEKSIEAGEVLLSIYPSSSRGHYLLGVVYQKNGNQNQAIKLYRKSLELDPTAVQPAKKLKELEI
jgi:predicted alpha/beta superfamily hydrolase